MRSMIFALTLTLYFALGVPVAEGLDIPQCPSPQTCDNNPAHLEDFVRSFYTWYVVSIFENNESWDSGPLKKKFQSMLTPKLFKYLGHKLGDPDWDIDLVTCSQDYNYTWFYPTARVTDMKKYGTASIEVGLSNPIVPENVRMQPGYRPEPVIQELNVNLKVERGKWLIDSISSKDCKMY